MPIQHCEINGSPGFKFGKKGACYVYDPSSDKSRKDAKRKAQKQGASEHIKPKKGE